MSVKIADLIRNINGRTDGRRVANIVLHPIDLAGIEEELIGSGSSAVYATGDESAPPNQIPPGAAMLFMGVPVYSQKHEFNLGMPMYALEDA